MGYTHETVNHLQMFMSPNGVQTQDVESLWAHCKRKSKHTNVGSRRNILSYLDKFLWRRKRSV